jgi:adenylylsulfate kinase-like enzyme
MDNKSSKVKIAYVIINKFTGVSDEYDSPCTDTEIHICAENRKGVEKVFTKGVNT